ncbi:hypothetical protein AB0B69_04910, partial [Micromonospora parva]|uniref:hypothetical protein n=1 Tax=Micromonospora parva TaxID=1464048 RepID=UPI00340D1DAA
MPGADSAGVLSGNAPVGVPLGVVLRLVCGCSLRTQQGACKASANYDLYPGLVRPFGLAGWDSFGNNLFVAGIAVQHSFLLESLILAQD